MENAEKMKAIEVSQENCKEDWEEDMDDETRLDMLSDHILYSSLAAYAERKNGKTDSAYKTLKYLEQAQVLCEKLGDREKLAEILQEKGNMYELLSYSREDPYLLDEGKIDNAYKAIECLGQASKLFEETGNRKKLAEVLMEKGNMHKWLMYHYDQGYHVKDGDGYQALKCFEDAAALYQSLGDREGKIYANDCIRYVEDFFYDSQCWGLRCRHKE